MEKSPARRGFFHAVICPRTPVRRCGRSDGTQTTKRGFASERAARDARRRLIEQIERGEVRHTAQTFGGYWEQWLHRRRPYLEPGTWSGYEAAGRKRLLPAFGGMPLGELSVDVVRAFVSNLADEVEAGEMAAKTVNNALGTLVVCLHAAVEDGVLGVNPALRVQRLPPAHIEREYLRLDEIPRYVDACSEVYRPLAELLIGSGLRISEALALRIRDLELEKTGGCGRRLPLAEGICGWIDQVGSVPPGRDRSRPELRPPRSGCPERRAGSRRPCNGRGVHHADSNREAKPGSLGERGNQPTARPQHGLARLAQRRAPGRRAA
jgi:hypothetical protein